jgi:hypothetical protein
MHEEKINKEHAELDALEMVDEEEEEGAEPKPKQERYRPPFNLQEFME